MATNPTERQPEFEITVPRGPMVCGYCGETERWRGQSPIPEHLAIGYLELTGYHCLGVGPEGELVVLAEATGITGQVVHLPHLRLARRLRELLPANGRRKTVPTAELRSLLDAAEEERPPEPTPGDRPAAVHAHPGPCGECRELCPETGGGCSCVEPRSECGCPYRARGGGS